MGTENKVQSYKELHVWKKGIEIVNSIYEITSQFPAKEQYGLASQMQRAAVSIPSNIAEGFARQHTKEYLQFCYVALGSCAELNTQLIIVMNRKYVSGDLCLKLEMDLDVESRMLMNLIKSLKRISK